MADRYEGPVRIYAEDGVLLTGGVAALEIDHEMGNWTGLVQTLDGTGVSGKALVTYLETTEGRRGKAQLVPEGVVGEKATSKVTGLGERPF